MRVAAVDLGTNTFLCLIADVDEKGLRVVEDLSRVVRLGEKVNQNRAFLPQALDRARICLDEFSRAIKKNNVEKVVATATSAARDVKNGKDLLDLGRERSIPISIISGEKEAQLSFEGATSSLLRSAETNILVIDVGGGSTELIHRRARETKIKAISYDVGSVRLTEMFVKSDPINENDFTALLGHAQDTLTHFGETDPELVIAVAGTPTTLACIDQKIDFEENKVEGYILTREKIEKLVRDLAAMPLTQRQKVKGLEPLRADVIVAGGVLLLTALKLSGCQSLRVSTRGLRYGAALNYRDFS